MIYSDQEMLDWWKGLTELERTELFQKIVDADISQSFDEIIGSIWRRWRDIQSLTPKQIGVLRKWAR